jgi:N-hydroxyarylamine O-acetyltransferase
MHIDAYLERIAFVGRVRPDLATLTALQRAHLRAISYENLDVQLGRPVTIERAPIFEKMVVNRRGGWCYEMNGLFGWALAELGFRVTRSAGAVMREVSGDSSIGNHLVLKVELEEGIFLGDVGFGDAIPSASFRAASRRMVSSLRSRNKAMAGGGCTTTRAAARRRSISI